MPSTLHNPLVSVIIPAYNEGPLLASAIESALAQTYAPVEVVVVNDGSTDAITRETALGFGDRITYIERANGGVAAARNTGIEASRGELIALLDQDDVWLPTKLARQVDALMRFPDVALVHSSYYVIDANGTRTRLVSLPGGRYDPLPRLLVDVEIASCTALFRRGVLREVGHLESSLAGSDDWDLWLRIAARGHAFYCAEEPLAEYRVHASNVSHDAGLMIERGFRALDRFFSLPSVPAISLQWRDRAYAHRHAWAASVLYAEGAIADAARHLHAGAKADPATVTSPAFFRGLVSLAPDRLAAVRFALGMLSRAGVSRSDLARARANADLALALTSSSPLRAARHVASAIAARPGVMFDPALWAALLRRLRPLVPRVRGLTPFATRGRRQ